MTVWIDPSAASKHNVNDYACSQLGRLYSLRYKDHAALLLQISRLATSYCAVGAFMFINRKTRCESTSCLLSEQSDLHILRYLLHIYAKLCVQPCYFIRHLSQLSVVQVGCPACSNISRLLLSNLSPQPSHEPVSSLEQSPLLGTKRQCHPILPHHCQQRVFLGLIKRLDWA